jgi:replicative DNA helicase
MVNEKISPYDGEAEEAVIGSLLIDSDAMIEIAPFLKPEDFFTETNRWIYNACYDLFERHETINQITVAHELAKQEKLDEVGGASYLSKLVSTVPTSLHIESYARIVSRLSIMRRLIGASYKIASIGYDADPDVDSAISKAEDILFKVRQKQTRGDFIQLRDILDQYIYLPVLLYWTIYW